MVFLKTERNFKAVLFYAIIQITGQSYIDAESTTYWFSSCFFASPLLRSSGYSINTFISQSSLIVVLFLLGIFSVPCCSISLCSSIFASVNIFLWLSNFLNSNGLILGYIPTIVFMGMFADIGTYNFNPFVLSHSTIIIISITSIIIINC